jgi:hypothetical protein
MSPLLVVKGKTERSVFGFNTREAPSGTMWDFQENGWMDDRIGERCTTLFKKDFFKPALADSVIHPPIFLEIPHSPAWCLSCIETKHRSLCFTFLKI